MIESSFLQETAKARATRARRVTGVPTALSLFSGAGGLDLGFRMAGFRVLAASDIKDESRRTHEINFPDVPFIHGDLRELTVTDLVAALGDRRPDVIIGGPPCQGFSTLGDRLSADPRNDLVDAFMRIVSELRPQAVVIENVRAVATEYGGRYKDYILERLEGIGYKTSFAVLNAADYGVPQLRRRAFFIGVADPRSSFAFPEPTHGVEGAPYATVGQAIMDLAGREGEVPNHSPLDHSEIVLRRYQLIPEGGMLPPPEQLPVEIRRKNFGSTYKRLHRDKPSLTMVPGNNAFPVHPTLDRSLTPREAARIQTFPDDYVFAGDRRGQCKLVGDAVPPLLAAVLAKSVWAEILPLSGAAARLTSLARARSPHPTNMGVAPELKPVAMPTGLSFVDLFSGVGGFTVGFSRAGLTPLAAADHNSAVAAAHHLNFPEVPMISGDLSDPEVQDQIVATVGGATPFIVVGGPPCQGFSVFGRRRMAASEGRDQGRDPRNRLVLSFVDTVGKLNPQWVLMENVAGFATLSGGEFVRQVHAELTALGYDRIEHRILDAADYGVPQRRKRFVLIANRTGHVIPWPRQKYFAEPRDWQRPQRTVGEAIADLATPSSHENHTSHVPMNHKPLQVERYKTIPEGGRLDPDALPPELLEGYRTDRVKNFSHVYRRLHRSKPSLTLVPGHNAFPIHPWLNRTLTVREAARIQTFPDDMKFVGARQDQCIQVGNAFPPLLAELLANNIVKANSNGWRPGAVPSNARRTLLDIDDAVSPGDLEEAIG